MGVNICYNSETVYNDSITSQGDLIQVFQMEQQELKKKIESVNQGKRIYLDNKENKRFYSVYANNIKVYLNKIEENFYLVSLYATLRLLEKRFTHEKYQSFDLIKEEYFGFYKRVRDAFDYNFLMNENEKFNNFLDENLISGKYHPTGDLDN